jgi:hypothetical protein
MKHLIIFALTSAMLMAQTPAAVCPTQSPGVQSVAVVSAADFSQNSEASYCPFFLANGLCPSVAPSSIISLFASAIAPGVTATITDSDGRTLPLSFLSIDPGQANAVLPSDLANGMATVNLNNSQTLCGNVGF